METIVNRLKSYLDFRNISVSVAESVIGLSNASLSKPFKNGTTIKTDTLEKFLITYKEINSDWLLTGKGSMLKINSEDKKKEDPYKKNLIPLYNDVATIGGVNGMSAHIETVSSTTEYIDAGDWFPGATAAIRHYGDSMVEYPSGSILALKKVEDVRLLVWGRNYCIETTEYRITKRLNKSKKAEYLTGYSSNKETYPDGCLVHEPIDIPTETIRSIYQILGCVTKEYSNGIVEIAGKKN